MLDQKLKNEINLSVRIISWTSFKSNHLSLCFLQSIIGSGRKLWIKTAFISKKVHSQCKKWKRIHLSKWSCHTYKKSSIQVANAVLWNSNLRFIEKGESIRKQIQALVTANKNMNNFLNKYKAMKLFYTWHSRKNVKGKK
jgi:hypothetical protein